jgi:hypothetical protein
VVLPPIIIGAVFVLVALFGGVLVLLSGPRLLRGVLGTAAALPLVWSVHHDWACSRGFDGAAVGDERMALVVSLGSPRKVTLWARNPDVKSISPVAGRAECLWYYAFFSIEAYEFCFTADGRMDHKYDWQSW